MAIRFGLAAVVAALLWSGGGVVAQVPVGVITTLSGPTAYAGEDVVAGFQLAAEQEGGKLGGVPVRLIIEDDQQKPAVGRQLAERIMKREGARILSGLAFGNVLGAIMPAIVEEKAFYIASNAAPQLYLGENCSANFFAVSWYSEATHETAALIANARGYKRVVLLAPNYQAGREAFTGFKNTLKAEVAAEIFTKLDQTDYSAEIARIRSLNPDAILDFQPGGLGIAFLKQYAQSGAKIPLVSSGTDIGKVIGAGEAAVGVLTTAAWNHDLDIPANKAFVEAFRRKHGRTPSFFAANAYDSALLIGTGLKAVGGDMKKEDAFRAALRQANFPSVRGKFKFAADNSPILDWYTLVAKMGADGRPGLEMVGKVATDWTSGHAAKCKVNS